MIHELSSGTDYDVSYGRTTPYELIKCIRINYQADNRKGITESHGTVAWWYRYLLQINQYHSQLYQLNYNTKRNNA